MEIRFLLCLIFYVIKMMWVGWEGWPPEGVGVGRATRKRTWKRVSSLQNCEKTNCCCLNHPFVVLCYDSPSKLIHLPYFHLCHLCEALQKLGNAFLQMLSFCVVTTINSAHIHPYWNSWGIVKIYLSFILDKTLVKSVIENIFLEEMMR